MRTLLATAAFTTPVICFALLTNTRLASTPMSAQLNQPPDFVRNNSGALRRFYIDLARFCARGVAYADVREMYLNHPALVEFIMYLPSHKFITIANYIYKAVLSSLVPMPIGVTASKTIADQKRSGIRPI